MQQYYRQFVNKLNSAILNTDIVESVSYFGHKIGIDSINNVFIDGKLSTASSLKEAKSFIKDTILQENVINNLTFYKSELVVDRIINVIKEHHDVRVTNTIIDSYIEILKSKQFTTDPVVAALRQQLAPSTVFENRYDYVLDDGSTVVIGEQLQARINNIFQNHGDIVNYMRSCADNFLTVIDQLED